MKRMIDFVWLLTLGLILPGVTRAQTDQLLLKRSTRPLMVESTVEALRPWETPVEGFFVRSHHNTLPTRIDDSWTISFEGLLRRPKKMTLKSLKSQPQVAFHAVLECSGNGRSLFEPQVSGIQWGRGAVGNAEWQGVPLKILFKDLGIKPDAKFATFEGYDEPILPSKAKFVRSIPLGLLTETGAILAFTMNRDPLPVAHGGPVRLVMPNIYGQNWVKWVNKISFSAEPDQRAYAVKAYRMPIKPVQAGDQWDPVSDGKPIDYIRVQTIFTDPTPGAAVLPGVQVLRGKAFSGSGAVVKVEVSLDDGKSWAEASLSKRKDHSWQEFDISVEVRDGKTYEALARATDAKGFTQPLTQSWNPKGYLYNAVDRIRFSVSEVEVRREQNLALVRQHCLTCHSAEIIGQQKLNKDSWRAVVKKMADYGLILDASTSEVIAMTLADGAFRQKPGDDRQQIFDLAAQPDLLTVPPQKEGLAKSGRVLFLSHCAACHGADALGETAPRLRGRVISRALFFSTVKHGRRQMPPFESRLNTKDMENILAWLATDVRQRRSD